MKDMFRSIARYALRYRRTLLLLLTGLCFESLYDVGLRYSLKFIIDVAIIQGDARTLWIILGILAAGAVAFNVVVILCDYLWAKTGGKILNDVRLDIFKRLQELPLGYHRRSSVGDLSARFNADMSQIENGIVLALPMALMGVFEILLTLVLMMFVHPLLCALAALGICLSLLAPRPVQKRALEASFVLRREEGRMTGFVQENLSGQSIVKAFGLEAHAAGVFSRRLDVLLAALARANFLSYLVSRIPSLSFLLLQLCVLGVGGWLAISGRITIGDLVAYQALLLGLNSAIYNLTWMMPSFIDASAAWRRIKEILDEPVGIEDRPGCLEIGRFSGSIEFRDVTFRYPGTTAASLKKINVQIRAGEYVVFVGRSGAGKSSLANLLLRFYEATEGEVRIDGVDVRQLSLASLRSQVGLVSQDIMLFDLTVRENIRLGALGSSDDEVIAAAQAAEINDLIMSLPEGYDTVAGAAGVRFSGGERQRIALARALVRRPAILVLDEFSSALDPATEADILSTIERFRGSCTILSISHRLSTAARADRCIVMRNGRVIEDGRHADLLSRNGEYARLWGRAAPEGTRPPPGATPVAE